MQVINLRGDFEEYLLDDNCKIPQAHLHSICKYGCGKNACRYVFLIDKGFVCVKKSPIKQMLDERVKKEEANDRGDNCEGLGRLKKS